MKMSYERFISLIRIRLNDALDIKISNVEGPFFKNYYEMGLSPKKTAEDFLKEIREEESTH